MRLPSGSAAFGLGMPSRFVTADGVGLRVGIRRWREAVAPDLRRLTSQEPPMIETLEELPAGVVGVRATGQVTREDYENVIEPIFDAARREGAKLRLLFDFAPQFEGFTAGAVWADTKVGLRNLRRFERCAITTDRDWLRRSAQAVGALLPADVRVFPRDELDHAVGWLARREDDHGLRHKIHAREGVIVIEPHGRLRPEDFDAAAAAIDPLLEGDGAVRGLVVHAHSFPGWENFEAFSKHLRFVRDHHERLQRVAVAADGEVASLAPRLAAHFTAAEVRRFGYHDLDDAIAWAGGDGRGT